jgi:superfamily II DNA or RNA helicase
MQIEALHKLLESRNNNKNKALIISATGTGKTILAAFDVRRFVEEHQKAKVLFIAHRELLLTQAKDKFERIIGDKIASYGFYNGHNDSKCDCLFTTNIMLSKNLQNFKFDEFDYIIIDESHRSASNTYQNIFEYFKPKFLLGMTATPERADDAEIVFSLFDHNVPYEIRLQKALELDILSPFHYYAVSDVEQIEDLKKINQLEVHTGDERVDYLIEKINLYRQADTILKGLIFCSRIDEAKILSNKFNAKGFKTVSLSGSDNENQRETAIEDLENGKLDLIFTVDIFNEGVDIPSVNFVGLCRNTQSSVVFIQQLGRGLRKCKGKDDVVIVDFIGNYDNNYMIPLALFGKSGVTNDKLRNRVFDPAGQDINIGYSSISFDKIAKQKIFDSISPAKLKGKKNIADDCKLLNAMLGRLPFLFDFYNEETLDPRIIMSRNDFNSIVDVWNYAFDKSENFSKIELNESQKYVINFLSQELLNGIRLQELKMLKQLLVNETINFNDFEFEIDGAINVLKGNFFDKKYDALNIIDVDELNNKVSLSRQFQSDLNNELFKKLIEDAIMTGLKINETEYKNAENLVIGKQYSYVDVWRLLNFTKTEVWLNVGGYKTINKVTPIFVKYQKDDRVSSNVRYDDHFESPSKFVSISKSGRSRQSNEVKNYIDGTRHLFVRKSDDDGKFFYYLGTTQINTYTDSEANGENGQVAKTVTFDMTLDTPVEEHLYRYITEG